MQAIKKECSILPSLLSSGSSINRANTRHRMFQLKNMLSFKYSLVAPLKSNNAKPVLISVTVMMLLHAGA